MTTTSTILADRMETICNKELKHYRIRVTAQYADSKKQNHFHKVLDFWAYSDKHAMEVATGKMKKQMNTKKFIYRFQILQPVQAPMLEVARVKSVIWKTGEWVPIHVLK